MGVIGPLEQETIDYFTKWLEAAYYIRQDEERDQESGIFTIIINIIMRTSTGAKPHYDMEAVLPAQKFRFFLTEAEYMQSRYDQLILLDEKQMSAICHGQCYQRRMARAWNWKVRPSHLKEGDFEPTIR